MGEGGGEQEDFVSPPLYPLPPEEGKIVFLLIHDLNDRRI